MTRLLPKPRDARKTHHSRFFLVLHLSLAFVGIPAAASAGSPYLRRYSPSASQPLYGFSGLPVGHIAKSNNGDFENSYDKEQTFSRTTHTKSRLRPSTSRPVDETIDYAKVQTIESFGWTPIHDD